MSGHICVFSHTALTIEVAGEVVSFDWHDYLGPTVTGPRGGVRHLPNKHHFWAAIEWWLNQGKRVTSTGRCVYEAEATVPILKHLAGRHYQIVGHRIPDWATAKEAPHDPR